LAASTAPAAFSLFTGTRRTKRRASPTIRPAASTTAAETAIFTLPGLTVAS
jgi:hypothetical protein